MPKRRKSAAPPRRASRVRRTHPTGPRLPVEPAPPEFISDSDADWRAYLEEADELPAASSAEAQRILEVRAGFMEALVHDPRVIALFEGWLGQLAHYGELEDRGEGPVDPVFDVLPLVQVELGVRWPWVAVELLHTFHRMVQLRIADPVKALPEPGSPGVLAPRFELGFTVEHGESTEEARARLTVIVAVRRSEGFASCFN